MEMARSMRSLYGSDGLGLLPIKAICHYNASMAEALKRLEAHGEPLEVVALAEEKFVVITR